MGGVERAADLLDHGNGLRGRKLSMLAQQHAQVLAIHVFHGDEANAVGFTKIVDADHVLVSDVAGENQFLFEARQNARICGEFGTDDFESDDAVQFAVARLVHRAHAALSEHTENLVALAENETGLERNECGDAAGGRGIYR